MPWLGASPSRTLRGMTVRKTFSLKKLADVGRDLLAQIRALVEHREQHAFDVESGVERGADAAHRADEIGETFEREVLAVQRNQHGVGGDERVEREQAERGRTVDEDVVVVVAQRMRAAREAVPRARQRDHLDFGAGQVAVGGDERAGGRCVVGMMNGPASVVGSSDGQRVVDGAGFRRRRPFWPTPLVRLPWGSTSTRRTRRSANASEAARLMVVVVFPTPPF